MCSSDLIYNGAADFQIGSREGTSGAFPGRVDQVGLWKKVLSAGEISDLYNSGSMYALSGYNPYTVVVKNLNREYKFGSVPRINLFAREKYPLKNFVKGTQQSQYLSSSLLPQETYYSIKDNESENVLIDFDDYTKLSCDGSIHYFKLDTTSLPVEDRKSTRLNSSH